MNKTRLYELAYSYRGAKLWKQLAEEELFAVRLPPDGDDESIGYCFVMGATGQHTALAVYRGGRAFSTYREFCDVLHEGFTEPRDALIQDCMHCSFEQKDFLTPEELDQIKAYCKKTGIPARAPFPKFVRFQPFCVPGNVTDDGDWKTLENALRVAVKMAEVVKRSGKAALGLRPVYVSADDETYGFEQMDMFSAQTGDDEVTIPLYSLVNGSLLIERIPLPPYTKRTISPPAPVDEKTIENLKRGKQKGIFECELVRLPEPVEGKPPFFPVALFTVDGDGFLREPQLSSGPMVDADEMLSGFIASLGNSYPKAIRVRTEETFALLQTFCKKANILLTITDTLEYMDEVIDELFDRMMDDDDDFDDDDDDDDDDFAFERAEIVAMLESLSVAEIRRMPDFLLDQILAMAEYFPAELIEKVRRAKGK